MKDPRVTPLEEGSLDASTDLNTISAVLQGKLIPGSGDAIAASSGDYAPSGNKVMLLLLADKRVNLGTMLKSLETQISALMARTVVLHAHIPDLEDGMDEHANVPPSETVQ